MSRLTYVPPDYVAIENATQEQVDACNDKMLFTKVQFATAANPDIGDKRKTRWFNQCLKHEQGVSSLAGPAAKKEYEDKIQAEIDAIAVNEGPVAIGPPGQGIMAGFGGNSKMMIMVGVIGVMIFLVGKKKKWF